MKLLVVFVLCFVAVQGEPPKIPAKLMKDVMDYVKQCKTEGNVPKDVMSGLMQKKMPTEETGKCFLFCIHKKFGALNDDGSKVVEKIQALITEVKEDDPTFGEKVEIIATKCMLDKEFVATTPCDIATEAVECYLKTLPEVGIKI